MNEKLVTWIEGAELKLQKAQYNKSLLLASIAAVGAATAITSSNSSVETRAF